MQNRSSLISSHQSSVRSNALDLIVSKDALFIRSQDFVERGLTSLVIQRNTKPNYTSMVEMDAEETQRFVDSGQQLTEKEYIGPIYGIVGILLVHGQEFLCVVNEIQNVGFVHNMKHQHGIQMVKSVMMFPVQKPVDDKHKQ